MASSSEDFSGGSGADSELYVLHEAADVGDLDALQALLADRAQRAGGGGGGMDIDDDDDDEDEGEDEGEGGGRGRGRGAAALLPVDDPLLQAKDQFDCTPLHVAILRGHVDCARALVKAGASAAADADGCPALHLAACVGALPGREAAARALLELLLGAGADPLQRDDGGRLALHWACELGLVEAVKLLLTAAEAASAALAAQMAEAAAADAEASAAAGLPPPPPFEAPNLLEVADACGDTQLHAAARFDQAATLRLLLAGGAERPSAAAAATRNKAGLTPLAMAARHGAAASAAVLLKAHPEAVALADKHGRTPAALAASRGHAGLAEALRTAGKAGKADAFDAAPPCARAPTLVVAPPECEQHLTCPDPLPRGAHPPPENVERLRVLTAPGRGILTSRAFAPRLAWETSVAPAPMADVLRVHDWSYVRGLQAACASIPDRPDATANLDPDTAVSRHTFHVALRAAAAACVAVDRVVRGEARNAFCAVRPPGHHAGPRGVVTSKKDRNGSHGFCLLNNVAIAAAYAMNVHRHAGIQRVAILDFDVHHGNGTRACAANTVPSVLRWPFSTPLADGVVSHPTYSPWFDADDDDNILFASVQGYGPKSAAMPDVYVYPGSGATCDTAQLRAGRAAATAAGAGSLGAELQANADVAEAVAADVLAQEQLQEEREQQQRQHANGTAAAAPAKQQQQRQRQLQPGEAAAAAAAHTLGKEAAAAAAAKEEEAEAEVEEDPDGEFPPTTADDPPLTGPRLVEVAIPGPGFHPLLWRRAWRDKVLPAVVNFRPDLILVSAGFDAHRKDEINFRYVGATEADYEWLTDQIVQVANRVCDGRVVSVLEGGYNINGGIASAFARSVAAHVRGLCEPHSAAWDPEEARAERAAERRRREERAAKAAAKKAAALARLQAAQAAEAEAAAAAAGDGSAPAAATAGGGGEDGAAAGGGGRAKRRRAAAVDYAALNAKLEREAAAGGGGKPAE